MWPAEAVYDAILRPAAIAHRIPLALVKGLIGEESRFRPDAYRFEPLRPDTAADDDASRGLMQILLSTARSVGYTGDAVGLFDPATNVEYGLRYLRQQLDRARGDVRGAISAYNGGWRPALGFGAPADHALTICLAKDAAGKCRAYHAVPPGEFANQAYVDGVITATRYFAAQQQQSLQDVEQALQTGGCALGALLLLVVPSGLLMAHQVGERLVTWLAR